MTSPSCMLVAGEASGDLLAAELVGALRQQAPAACCFGAGGPQMAAAGVELAFDLTRHSAVGLSDVIRKYFDYRRFLHQLRDLAVARKPEVIIGVDFSGFNRRLVHAIREVVRAGGAGVAGWNPRMVQFVSPQVWASRPGRVRQMAQDYDLVLAIFPFEKAWYARHAPALRVEFVGHPMLDRYPAREIKPAGQGKEAPPEVLLLPGSRVAELRRHLPVMIEAACRMQRRQPITFRMVLPEERLRAQAQPCVAALPGLEMQVGGLASALARADLALASTGTVTMECAFFGVPTVTLYKTSWSTYQIGRRIIRVKSLTMPNLLAGETVFPEFIQDDATPENLATAASGLLESPERRAAMQAQLARILESLGGRGASQRAAQAILGLAAEPSAAALSPPP